MLYPIKFGHPFIKGEFLFPVVKGYSTQTTVKSRWSDGTVCYAIFCFYVEGAAGLEIDVKFEEGLSVIGTPPLFPYDATIEIAGVQVSLKSLPIKDWIVGPIFHSFICADHTGTRDILTASGTKARPWFIVDYWPVIDNAEIRCVMENSNTEYVGECIMPTRVTIGTQEVYSNLGINWEQQMSRFGGRWTRRIWLKGAPPTPSIIRHDVAHMAATGVIPNFDSSCVIPEARIQSVYQDWQNCNKNLGPIFNNDTQKWQGKPGLWQPAMGAAGARPDIGVYPTWPILWLFSGDQRMREVSMNQVDLWGGFGCQLREGNPNKHNYKGIATTLGRPSLAAYDYTYNYTTAEDRVHIASDMDAWGWTIDLAHRPNAGTLEYILTGDYYCLETLLMNASHGAMFSNGAAFMNSCGRGPTGQEGHIPGTSCGSVRQQAWGFLHNLHALVLCPDDMQEKAYFLGLVKSFIEINEGIRGLNTGNTSLNYTWGSITNQIENNPLNFWEAGNGSFAAPPLNSATCSKGISGFESGFMGFVLGLSTDLQDLGFDSSRLTNYFKSFHEGMIMHLGPYISAYRYPTSDINGVPYTTWDQVKNGFDPTYDPWNEGNSGFNIARTGDHGYTWIARAAAATLRSKVAFDWMVANGAESASIFNDNPKWSQRPRKTA